MNIWTFDLGTMCGWSMYDPNYPTTSGTNNFSLARGESPGMRFVKFKAALHRMIGSGIPHLVLFEQPHNRGGAATAILNGMEAILLSFCAEYSINHAAIHSSTLKKWATGRGNAKKPEMIARAKQLFPDREVVDDNEADALILLAYGIDTYSSKED